MGEYPYGSLEEQGYEWLSVTLDPLEDSDSVQLALICRQGGRRSSCPEPEHGGRRERAARNPAHLQRRRSITEGHRPSRSFWLRLEPQLPGVTGLVSGGTQWDMIHRIIP